MNHHIIIEQFCELHGICRTQLKTEKTGTYYLALGCLLKLFTKELNLDLKYTGSLVGIVDDLHLNKALQFDDCLHPSYDSFYSLKSRLKHRRIILKQQKEVVYTALQNTKSPDWEDLVRLKHNINSKLDLIRYQLINIENNLPSHGIKEALTTPIALPAFLNNLNLN
jgi:hypothetical protein